MYEQYFGIRGKSELANSVLKIFLYIYQGVTKPHCPLFKGMASAIGGLSRAGQPADVCSPTQFNL